MKDKLKNIDVFFLQYTHKFSYYHITCNHFYRILKGKEDIKRVGEKFCIYSQKKNKKKIWIHAASVGELMSIVPIIQKLEKNKKIKNILLSTSTTSSAKIFKKLKLKKTTQYIFH